MKPPALVVTVCLFLNLLTASAASAGDGPPTLDTPRGPLAVFPADNPWNQDISRTKVHARSQAFIASIGLDKPLHPDFGTTWQGRPSGIPFALVPGDQPKAVVDFEYAAESDPGPYPIPDQPPIEGGSLDASNQGDRHVLLIDYERGKLYELYAVQRTQRGWRAGSGAIFDLGSNALRPATWTSADAAGLPIFPGLVRYDEVVEKGEIRHALRFTARRTQRGYILPARHWASRSRDADLPPMGLRVRLRADYDISGFPPEAQVILRALKRYGMILADNGSDWFVTGTPHPGWNDEALATLKWVRGRDFEAVDTGPTYTEANPEPAGK